MRLTRVLVAVVIAISIPAVVSASIQYDLPFSVTEPFSISYDAGTSMVTSILGGVTLTVIDGESVMDQSQATGNGLDNLWIQGAILNDGFTFTGNAVLTWTGAAPTQSRLAFQIKVGKLGIVSTEESSWGRIKKESGGS